MKNIEGEIVVLKTLGIEPNYAALGREYGMDQRTAKRKYLGIENKKRGRKEGSMLDKYKEIIKEKLTIPGVTIKAVYKYIVMNMDKDIGTYSNFYKYVNKDKEYFIQNDKKAHPRFETECGKQLQFDWKEDLKMISKQGEIFEFNIFSATLGYSRMHNFVYSRTKTREDVERCLIETFKYINGVTKYMLTDNMRAVVDINNNQRKINPEFKQFAKDMGTNIKVCKPRMPETKGKDETCNKFMAWLIPYNHEFEDEKELIEIIKKIRNTVNATVNQTTNVPPILLYEKEKEHLSPLPNNKIMLSYLDTKNVLFTRGISFDAKQYIFVAQAVLGEDAATAYAMVYDAAYFAREIGTEDEQEYFAKFT